MRTLHLYLALAFGLPFVLAGITGVALAWMPELDGTLNPGLMRVPGRTAPLPAPGPLAERAALMLAQDARYGKPTGLQLPEEPDGVIVASYRTAKPASSTALAVTRQVMVDPVTLTVLGERNWGEFGLSRPLLTSTLFHLHRYLFAGEAGKTVMGVAGLALALVAAVGIALWWPRATWNAFVKSFAIAGHWRTLRFHYSFHRSAGMIAAPVLLVLGFSGLYFNLPDWVRPAVAAVATVTPPAKPKNAGKTGTDIGAAQAVAAAQAYNPAGRVSRIGLPAGPRAPYEIRMRQPGEVRKGDGNTRLFIDAYTGRLVGVRDPLRAPAGDTFLNWQYPLHTGEAFGTPGRLLISVAGITPLAFMVTGLVLWLSRRRRRAAVAQPAPASSPLETLHKA
ncbi:PepSY-associated TM helix domain-containing protein [Pseudoduganella flava]|uniref:PepSY-associated TM helix domain-containing protein n=1 Tax=Pseudoduganella flava TaxID=871742 RepID=UPI001E5FCDBC|nr:PepSY-associated TM helix domain-containing protein [Pseudoduganella flava]